MPRKSPIDWLTKRPGPTTLKSSATALLIRSAIESTSGDAARANALAREARELVAKSGDLYLRYWASLALGTTARTRGLTEEALISLQEALSLAEAADDAYRRSGALYQLSVLQLALKNGPAALTASLAAFSNGEAAKSAYAMANARMAESAAMELLHRPKREIAAMEEALAIARTRAFGCGRGPGTRQLCRHPAAPQAVRRCARALTAFPASGAVPGQLRIGRDEQGEHGILAARHGPHRRGQAAHRRSARRVRAHRGKRRNCRPDWGVRTESRTGWRLQGGARPLSPRAQAQWRDRDPDPPASSARSAGEVRNGKAPPGDRVSQSGERAQERRDREPRSVAVDLVAGCRAPRGFVCRRRVALSQAAPDQ